MSKKIAIAVISSLLLSQSSGFCVDANRIRALDEQRNEVLKQITAQLVAGKIGPTDAQQLKTGLDTVMQMETNAQEDQNVSDAEYANIKTALEKVQSQVEAAIHPKKVWMGIDSHDTSMQKKINDALAARKINKDQAFTLIEEEEKLRARETNGNFSSEFEFTDAMSIANDLLSLKSKIDQLASAGHTQ